MTDHAFHRMALLAGADAMKTMAETHVIVFGLGGVGSWCAEALARSGIGRISIVDSDTVCVTNINRQVQAVRANIGEFKSEALKKRIFDINPGCAVTALGRVFSRDTAGDFEIHKADYVIDAIDSLSNKLDLIEITTGLGVRIFSSMGMAQKLDPSLLKAADIWETNGCPLARLVRAGLRKRGFAGNFTVVYSEERIPLRADAEPACGTPQCFCPSRGSCAAEGVEWCSSKKVINGSAVTVTATAGMILASLVIRSVCG
ncbi:MAG: tRNA threonylcarbamoyladenosine dehydratase [Spirochaetia bacterium]|jgi:tRNA A37 threonylcarbamoyladenosine dehydratase|nr:tRNA threonylcarbamoyladenosine dehydratase [Spirochaetia bacterium]